ncbi:MAG: hypothetical protein EOO08_14815 [Chitinophagaceae bacterium]|nr:MAG: hypothetical protein EOO08_14815 [Chitinophagaceae bacterium]
MKQPKSRTSRETLVVQGLFVVVLLTFFAAERARALVDSHRPGTETATRTATGAAATTVARR